jgi:hypothetical protein
MTRPGSTFPPHPHGAPGAAGAALTLPDFLCMSLGFAFTLVVSLVLSHGRMFWEDEMLGWMLLTDPSWHHMVQAWKMGADGGGFSFYVAARAWLHLFGPSEIAFRMYSAVFFGFAFVLTFLSTQRFYGRWIAAFAVFNTFFCSPPLVLHMAEGRFYGMLVCVFSLTVWLAFKLQDFEASPPAWFFVLTLLAHAVLVTTHVLGVCFSFFVLLAIVVLDRLSHRLRPGLYACVAVTWLLLIPEREALHATAQVGKPWFWTAQPTPVHLLGPFTGFSAEIVFLMFLLILSTVSTLLRQRKSIATFLRQSWTARRPVYVVSASMVLLAVAFLLEGLVGTVLFVSRYLMPLALLTTFLTAELLQWADLPALLPARFRRSASGRRTLRWISAAALATIIILWVFVHLPPFLIMQPNYADKLTAKLPKGVPVLIEDGITFTEIIGREHASGVQYLFPLDWDQAASPYAPRLEVTQYNLMNNWRKVGYFSGSIVNLKDFLAHTPSFLAVDAENPGASPIPHEIGNPLVARFAQTPGYSVRRYASITRDGTVITAWRITHDPSRTGLPTPKPWP